MAGACLHRQSATAPTITPNPKQVRSGAHPKIHKCLGKQKGSGTMPLAKCRKCGKEINTQTKTCPNCGAGRTKDRGILRTFFVFLTLAAISIFYQTLKEHDKRLASRRAGTPARTAEQPVTPPPGQTAQTTRADSRPAKTDRGKWIVSTEKNPADGTNTVTLALVADEGRSRRDKKVSLILRCKSGKTDLYINWKDFLGNDARVLTRVGSENTVTRQWSLSTDKRASFYPGSPIRFIKKMTKNDTLVVQATPHNGSPIAATFDIRGLENALKPLQKACH
jgi:ribosomal protein L37E